MVVFDPEYLLLALILIVPGFIAAFIGVTLGVVEQRISNAKWVIVSLVSSLVILSGFLRIAQLLGDSITSPESVVYVFFTPEFQITRILILLALSVTLGLIYAAVLARNFHVWLRGLIWMGTDRKRNPWQPWEGTMKDAHLVQVITQDDELVAGELAEYSRAGRDRQLVLRDVAWFKDNQDNPQNPESKEVKEVFFDDEIKQVSILMTENGAEKMAAETDQKEEDDNGGSEAVERRNEE
ncbi:DUF6338 family protein [Halobellus salinisoli]|uniref:DUF6338 family protein n=1 Tax=Halobellus salinisoli TaxID=3108500 RepID=UPI0030094149